MNPVEFDGYLVYPDGRIKSMRSRKVFLKGYDVGKGYSSVKINNKNYYRHAIIAHCFLGPKPEGMTVNHKDGNKLNNHYTNLEYVSVEENYAHALDNNLKRNLGYYLTAEDASDLIEMYHNTDTTSREIASYYGFSCKGVFLRLLKGKYTYRFKNN